MRYVEARIVEYTREEAYRLYMARSIQLVPQNQWLTAKFSDLLNNKPVDNRTGDEIAAYVIQNAGLSFG